MMLKDVEGTSHHPGTASLTGSSNNVAANPEEAEPSSTHLCRFVTS